MNSIDIPITRGELLQRLKQTAAAALACGALQPIDTCRQVIEEAGIPFSVYVARSLQRKQTEKVCATQADPFLPPEPLLTVGAVGESHIAVLNKFNVVDRHLLMVTRRFEPQESLLTLADLAALSWGLAEIDGLGFYNGGTEAGASQHHKHLQLIPAQPVAGATVVPVEAVFPERLDERPQHLAELPFPHRIAGLTPGVFDAPEAAAARLYPLYREMLGQLGQGPVVRDGLEYQAAPYNLLLTRRWLMLVPRTREHFGDISVNAMGFAGTLFVRDEEGLEEIRGAGPVALLQAVST